MAILTRASGVKESATERVFLTVAMVVNELLVGIPLLVCSFTACSTRTDVLCFIGEWVDDEYQSEDYRAWDRDPYR